MIKRLLSMLRATAPPLYLMGIALIAWGFAEWGFLQAAGQFARERFASTRQTFVLMATGAMALYRSLAFHPVFMPEYYRWLRLTPWRLGRALPVGPAHVAWPDALWLGLLTAGLHGSSLPELLGPLALFLCLHAACQSIALWLVAFPWRSYSLVFGIGGVFLLSWESATAAAIAAICVSLEGHVMMRAAWRAFPWGPLLDRRLKHLTKQEKKPLNLTSEASWAGWPAQGVAPKPPRRLPASERMALCLLAGWWALAVLWGAPPQHARVFGSAMILFGGGGACLERTIRHLQGVLPPFNVFGRLRTRRLIIWSYDRALLTPMAMFLLVIGAAWAMTELPAPYVTSIGLAAILVTGQLGPPDWQTWRLTAPARLTAALNKQEFEKL